MNTLKELLDERMKQSIFYIPNDENYDAVYEICAAVVSKQTRDFKADPELRKLRGLDAHFEANNKTVKHLGQIKENDPELHKELMALGNRASELRRSRRISLSSVSVKFNVFSRIKRIVLFLLLVPYAIPAAVLTLPMTLICQLLFKKLKDYAFRNSVRYVINLVMWPLLMAIYSAVAYSCLPWQWALPITIAALPAPIIVHEVYRLTRIFKSDIMLWRSKDLRECYAKIREIIYKK